MVRSVSAGVGFLAAIGFFLIAWRWHTVRMAALGTILFVTSSWFLHVSRFANAEIMLFGLVGLVASVLWLKASRDPTFPFFASVVVCGLVLYIPGFIWFIVAGLLWQRSMLALQLRRLNTGYVVLASLFGCALIAPLFWGFIQSPQILKPFFGLPNDFPSALQIAKNLINIPLYLLWRGPNNPAQALGRLPILDVFTSAMLGLGVYAYYIRRRLDQTKLLFGIFVVGSLLIALGGPVSITVLIPFVYIVATAGMALLLQQWFTVFPKNPLARSIGASIITIAVLFTGFYHINRYFIAWPNAPATRNAFSIKK